MVLAVAAFLPQLVGQSVVLRSPFTLSGCENLGTFSLNVVSIFELERVVNHGLHQRFTAMRRDQVYMSQKEDV